MMEWSQTEDGEKKNENLNSADMPWEHFSEWLSDIGMLEERTEGERPWIEGKTVCELSVSLPCAFDNIQFSQQVLFFLGG